MMQMNIRIVCKECGDVELNGEWDDEGTTYQIEPCPKCVEYAEDWNKEMIETKPEVTRVGPLDMQVCVPKEWDDDQVKTFANCEQMCGTTRGWQIRKEGNKALNGDPERVLCEDREGFVHVMLDA